MTFINIEGMKEITLMICNIEQLSENEKYELFKKYKPTIIFAIKRAYQKFDSIPLEIEDFEYYAWEAYNELISIYYKRKMRKSFTSCLVDAVYWKTLNVCSKYVTNKFKVVNNCMRTSSYMNDEYNLNRNYADDKQLAIFNDIGWNQLLENYFKKFENEQPKRIFLEYVYGTHVTKIAKKEAISISKTKTILNKIISELKQIIDKQVF